MQSCRIEHRALLIRDGSQNKIVNYASCMRFRTEGILGSDYQSNALHQLLYFVSISFPLDAVLKLTFLK
jgi:hypothetical protein